MKYEWKKQEKGIYLPKTEPQLATIENHSFFAIKGEGNPNESDFSERVGVLYSLAYAVRMMPKTGFTPKGYFEYTVYPLEGIWDACDAADKSSFMYTIMIRQLEFATDEVISKALENTKNKKPHPLLQEVFFTEIEDGLSVQIMHEGDYDNEPESFEKMAAFMKINGLIRSTNYHREIYLSDVNKVARDKLKTVLRWSVCRL